MLAVTREARGLGLGRELKVFQREILLPLGVETVYWTYDPSGRPEREPEPEPVGRVAGRVRRQHVRRGHGERAAQWAWHGPLRGRLADPEFPGRLADDRWLVRPADAGPRRPFPSTSPLPETAWVEVPPNIGRILRSSPEDASVWRRRTRAQFQEHLEAGYGVTGFSWREEPEPDAGEGAGAPSGADAGGDARTASVLNRRRYYYRLEKLDGTEKQ